MIHKFRGWDKDNLQMYYSDQETDNGEGPIVWGIDTNGVYFEEMQMFDTCPGGMGHQQDFRYARPNQIIMQYTGIKDKNGLDIWESDIIKTASGLIPRIIVWEGGSFHCRAHNYIHSKDMPTYPVLFWQYNINLLPEIIGNCYENPYLLTEKEK